MPRLIDRTGEKNVDRQGFDMEIEKYINNKEVLVKFPNENYQVWAAYSAFKNGSIKTPYHRTVYNVGYLGEGKHEPRRGAKATHKYRAWNGMMRRCYDDMFKQRSVAYKECVVSEKWHCFQDFGDWYDENYYEIDGETMNLDKDILVKGNKIYSPDTCIYVPARINSLFVGCESTIGKSSACTYFDEKRNKYIVRSRLEYIGAYDTKEDAFEAYKRHKELTFRDVANEYKDKIPEKLYNAMLNYKIEINLEG